MFKVRYSNDWSRLAQGSSFANHARRIKHKLL